MMTCNLAASRRKPPNGGAKRRGNMCDCPRVLALDLAQEADTEAGV